MALDYVGCACASVKEHNAIVAILYFFLSFHLYKWQQVSLLIKLTRQ